MRTKFLGILTTSCLALSVQAQMDNSYKDFPIVVTVQFQSLSVTFRNFKSNFSNIGFGLGTEVSLNGDHNAIQQITALWYHNKTVGNGLMVYTQTAWRLTIASNAYSELKAGAGYQYSFRPVESFRQKNGNWVNVGHKGKGMLMLPVGISLGYNQQTNGMLSPFITYQFLIASGYNKSVPLIPETLIQVGSRIHAK